MFVRLSLRFVGLAREALVELGGVIPRAPLPAKGILALGRSAQTRKLVSFAVKTGILWEALSRSDLAPSDYFDLREPDCVMKMTIIVKIEAPGAQPLSVPAAVRRPISNAF